MFKEWEKKFNSYVWDVELARVKGVRKLWIQTLRVITLAINGFNEDKCEFRASALTFYTTLSIVPIAAMLFGIAKGFGYDETLKQQLLLKFADHVQVVNMVIGFADKVLSNTKGGMIACIGVLVLIWTIIKVLGNIETSFNEIWEVKKPRSIFRKISDYLSLTLVCPFLIILSSSLTLFITANITHINDSLHLTHTTTLIYITLKFIPFIVMWILFTTIYLFMPNARVKFISAAVGGITAGTIFQLLQDFYIFIQLALSNYNIIYGSFSALPLFLIWLNVSWIIALFGAEIGYAHQHSQNFEFEPEIKLLKPVHRKVITLWLLSIIVKNFESQGRPLSEAELLAKTSIPPRLLKNILLNLIKVSLVSEVLPKDSQSSAYQPAIPSDRITISSTVRTLEGSGSVKLPLLKNSEFYDIESKLSAIYKEIENSPSNFLLKNI